MFDHHLDDRLSLYHVSYDGVSSLHNIHCSVATTDIVHDAREPTTVCAIHMTTEAWRCSSRFSGRVYHTKRRRYAEDKLCKKVPFWPSHLETPKDIATKNGESTYGKELIPSCKFHADRREISVPVQKYIFFLIETPLGYRPMLYIFIARQHTDARYWYSNSVCPFVRLSVRRLRSGIIWKRLKILL